MGIRSPFPDPSGEFNLQTLAIRPPQVEDEGAGKARCMMFGVLLFGSVFFGLGIAMLGHPAFYRALTGRKSGSADHADSKGL